MKTILYKSHDRGNADYGWLKARYSFSFANYYNPNAIQFGALRVLNDDIIDGGMGFGKHPHDNMEIISIPLYGAMKHRDSMSNEWIPLEAGEVQVMSAGTGIMHSEMNNDPNNTVNLFQIWILPDKANVKPRYDQRSFDENDRINKLQTLVSSIDGTEQDTLKIHQNAKISRVLLEEGHTLNYKMTSDKHGVFIMLISGALKVNETVLEKRDALGISEADNLTISAMNTSDILLIEVPMN